MESKRQLQVARLIQQNLGEVFQREGFQIFGRAMVTVTSVKVSPDLGMARAYLSIYNTKEKESVLGMINQEKRRLKKTLIGRIRNKLRIMPELEFFMDESLDEVFKMEKLFADLKKDEKSDSDEKSKSDEKSDSGEEE